MRFIKLFQASLIYGLLALGTAAVAGVVEAPIGVPVQIWGTGRAYNPTVLTGKVFVEGTGLDSPSDGSQPEEGDGDFSLDGVSDGETAPIITNRKSVMFEPGKIYYVTLGANTATTVNLNITPPPGYQVEIDGERRQRFSANVGISHDYSHQCIVRVFSPEQTFSGRAGSATALAGDRLHWQVGLGDLKNGDSAGALAIIDAGNSSSWTSVFTPAGLQYEPPSTEVHVYRSSGAITQILANQAVVDVETVSSTEYRLHFYQPSQISNPSSGFPYTFDGHPYVTYQIEQVGGTTALKIKSVTLEANNTPIRTAITTLTRTGTWPAFTWTKKDWNDEGATQLVEEVHTFSGTSARTDSVVVRVPSGATALQSSRAYTFYDWGEQLTSETLGSSDSVTTTYEPFTNPSDPGSYGRPASVSTTGGGWEAYDYWDSITSKSGQIKYRYRPPFGSTPSSITRNPAVGEVVYYDYSDDPYGVATRPSLVLTTVDGTEIGKTTIAYTDVGENLVQAVSHDYYDGSNYLTTTTKAYRENFPDAFLRAKVYSIQKPDGVKVSFAYMPGTFNGSTREFTALSSGTGSCVAVITGTSSSSAGTLCTVYNEQTVDDIYLVSGKSTAEVTLRDERALIRRTATYVYSDTGWVLISFIDYNYNVAGLLTERTASNGATYSAGYDGVQGELKVSETNEAGVAVSYIHDSAGRVLTAAKSSGPTTTFAYDAAGHVTSTTIGSSEQIVNSTSYDDAGRVHTTTPAGVSATTWSYAPSSRARTATAPDGGTTTETYNPDGRLASITGTAVVSKTYSYSIDSGLRLMRCDHGTSSRWEKTWQDRLGRTVQTERPGAPSQPSYVQKMFYDGTSGRLTKLEQRDSSNNRLLDDTLYEYDALGQVTRTGLDITNGGGLVLASHDRITDTNRYFEPISTDWWLHEEVVTYPTNDSNSTHTASITRTRLTGFASGVLSEVKTTTTNGAVITQTVSVNTSTKTVTTTTSQSGINDQVETTVNGLPTSIAGPDGLTYSTGYDALERPNTAVDPRTGTTTTVYKSGTLQPYTVTDATGLLATYDYDSSGRRNLQSNAAGKAARFEYNVRGQLYRQWGDLGYPVEHSYDSNYGDHLTQKTYRGGSGWNSGWPTSPGTADTVTWAYDAASATLTSKTDALSHAVTFDYNARGQTAHRVAARGASSTVTTTYSYDGSTGDLLGLGYTDGTPSVTYYYDRQGHVSQVDDVTGSRTFDLCACGRVNSETFPSAFYGTRVLTYLYETSGGVVGRYKGFQLGASSGSSSDLEQDYAYNSNSGRFEDLISKRAGNTVSLHYGYLINSTLVETLAITGGHAFSVARSYDAHRNLLTSLDSKWSGTSQTKFDYTYTSLMQRKTAKQSGSAFDDYWSGGSYSSIYNVYSYNDRGEVETAAMYRGNSAGTVSATPSSGDELPGRRFEYRYDSIGNRTLTRGTATATADDEDYTADDSNRYTAKENNVVRFAGTAKSGVSVALTGATEAASRLDRAWGGRVVPANTGGVTKFSTTVYAADPGAGTAGADRIGSETKTVVVPARSQSFVYDYAGNLIEDGIWKYTYDAEDRLVSMQTHDDAIGTGKIANADARRLEFVYDYLGRRVQKIVRDGRNSSTGIYSSTPLKNWKYLYDGWNLIAEFDALSTLTLVRSYTWGLDIQGSLAGTGGVGALLQIRDHVANSGAGRTWLPTYDGNGNVVSLLDAEAGSATIAATFEYGPFGEPLRAEIKDNDAKEVAFRFSTKFTDAETGLVYYGNRFYSTTMGRFINRDPIGEQGGLNLYGFVGNNAVNGVDYLGLTLRPKEGKCGYWVEASYRNGELIGVRATYRCEYEDDGNTTGGPGSPGESPGSGGGGFGGAGSKPGGTKATPAAPNKSENPDCPGLRQRLRGLKEQIAQMSLMADHDQAMVDRLRGPTRASIKQGFVDGLDGYGNEIGDMVLASVDAVPFQIASLAKLTFWDGPKDMMDGTVALIQGDSATFWSKTTSLAFNYFNTGVQLTNSIGPGRLGPTAEAATFRFGVWSAAGAFTIKTYEHFGDAIANASFSQDTLDSYDRRGFSMRAYIDSRLTPERESVAKEMSQKGCK